MNCRGRGGGREGGKEVGEEDKLESHQFQRKLCSGINGAQITQPDQSVQTGERMGTRET